MRGARPQHMTTTKEIFDKHLAQSKRRARRSRPDTSFDEAATSARNAEEATAARCTRLRGLIARRDRATPPSMPPMTHYGKLLQFTPGVDNCGLAAKLVE